MGRFIDLTGQRFERLLVLYRDIEYEKKHNLHKGAYWRCRCDCGNEYTAFGTSLRNGHVKSCGCLHKEKARINGGEKDLTGQIFSDLIVLERDLKYRKENNIKSSHTYWRCKCICGNIKSILGNSLLSEATKSCGCKMTIEARKRFSKDITNIRFGKLIAKIPKYEDLISKSLEWECQCDCGNIVNVPSKYLLNGHVRSCGCLSSYGEESIKNILIQNNISFEQQKTFNTCVFPNTNGNARFDFYIDNNFLLEYDGEQHYIYSDKGWNTQKIYLKTKFRDEFKNQWCKENNIPLKRIPYWDLDKLTIEDIMSNKYLIKGE